MTKNFIKRLTNSLPKGQGMNIQQQVDSLPQNQDSEAMETSAAVMELRAERMQIKSSETLDMLARLSNNLYSEASYRMRQQFFKIGTILTYIRLCNEIKISVNYAGLPAKTAQQVIKLVVSEWQAFFAANNNYHRNPKKFTGRPRIPKYRSKGSTFVLVFNNQQVGKVKKGQKIIFPERLGLVLSTRLPVGTILNGARIVPNHAGFMVEVLYETEVQDAVLNPQRLAGIDFGVENLVTIVNNIGLKPLVIKGKVFKAVNQYFNRELAQLRSQYAAQGIKTGVALLWLLWWRTDSFATWFHRLSAWIAQWCQWHNIEQLVVGRIPFWKQEVQLGKVTNQNFVCIPFLLLQKQLQYKCTEWGIKYTPITEEYTSKCSFLDFESLEHHTRYAGKRIHRGLFRSAKGTLINADVNAAYNIIRKVNPSAFDHLIEAEGVVDVGLHPQCLELYAFILPKQR